MDPQLQAMIAQALTMQQQGGMPHEHPLARAFGGMPMYGGTPIPPSHMFDLSGMPGFQGNTSMGMMVGMMLQGILPGMMGPNFVPGQFAPTQNLFDHRYATQHLMQRRRAVEIAAQADQSTYFNLVRGMARMAGTEFEPGGEQEQAAQRFAKDMTALTPILGDIMPDLIDKASGIRGSAAVAAPRIFEGGRYTFDPGTGRLGMSGESAGELTRGLREQLFGPGADITKMRGLGMGRIGQLYDEMVRRGVGPSTLEDDEAKTRLSQELSRPPSEIRSPELRKLRQDLGKTADVTDATSAPEAMTKLSKAVEGMNPQALEAALRSFNSTRTSQAIERMTGAVSAMRDIFGDMGRPNAPMVELLNGLQSMTQGGLAHMSPHQIERSVRETYAIAKYTGLGLEGIMGFAGTASQSLDQLGLHRSSAPQIAQSSAAYGFGFGLAGQPVNFGAMDKEMASQMDIRLRAQAIASPQAVRLAGLMKFADEFTRKDGERGFAEDTEAYALSEAIRRGSTEYTFGEGKNRRTESIFKSVPEELRILTNAGVSKAEAAQAMLRNPATAQRLVERYRLQDLVRQGQSDLDVAPTFSSVFANAAGVSLADVPGLTGRRKAQLAADIGASLFQETRTSFDDDTRLFDAGRERDRNARLAARVRERLEKQFGPDKLKGVSDEQLSNLVGNAFDNAEDFVHMPGGQWEAAKSFLGVMQLNSPKTLRLQKRAQDETNAIARFQTAMSSIGQASLGPRISDYLQDVGPGGGTFSDFLLRAAGAVPTSEVAGAAGAMIEHIADLQKQYDEAPQQYGKDPNTLRIVRGRLMDEIQRVGPDVGKLLQNDVSKLSPEGQKVWENYQNRQAERAPGAAGLLPTDPKIGRASREATAATAKLERVRAANIEGRGDVKTATSANTAAQDRLAKAKTGLADALATPEVTALQGKLAAVDQEFEDAKKKVIEGSKPGSGISGVEMERLIQRREALRTTGQTLGEELATAKKDAGKKQPAIDAQTELSDAQSKALVAQQALETVRKKAGAEADKDGEVIAQQEVVNKAYKDWNALRKEANLPDVAPLTPAQVRVAQAQADYREAKDKALESIPAVQEAKKRYDEASKSVVEAHKKVSEATNTPEVVASRESLSRATVKRVDIERQLREAEARGDKKENLSQLRKDLDTATKEERSARKEANKAQEAAEKAPGVDKLVTKEAKAQQEFEEAKKNLKTQEDKAGPDVATDEGVKKAREGLDKVLKAEGFIPESRPGGPPGNLPPGAGGRLPGKDAPGGAEIAGKDIRIQGATLNLTTQATKITDARVEITARDVRLTKENVPVTPEGKPRPQRLDDKGDSPDPATGATSTQRIIGTLKIEGLDRGTLDATGHAPNDPRSGTPV